MEVKTLLRLIKDDISHLEGITSEFNNELLPSSDELDVALVRANALLKELELLRKFTNQHEKGPDTISLVKEPKGNVEGPVHSEQEPFGLFENEFEIDKQDKMIIQEHGDLLASDALKIAALNTSVQPDHVPAEDSKNEDSFITDFRHIEELREVTAIIPSVNEHFTPLVEPAVQDNISLISPIVKMEEVVEKEADAAILETTESADETQHNVLENDNIVVGVPEIPIADKPESFETMIVSDVPDRPEEILAEEFSEVKKTINEVLGESHQMVNDILAPEKNESGYKLIPIDSIWDGIGINDRFLFVRELFANNSSKFEATVEALDQLGSIQDAVNFLKSNFKWNKTATSQKFLVLVKRRFIK